ncbi:hypothetical protein D9613_003222 [Agrocybe pediades]|uniref:Uncharacterized protein n=1 Tax=Agrocybe pediades TaxID=84607 RepID=A0A8H4VMT3_9AGAR|nr:hypothetical protein D9613_003222 [Agrocybe pediades]KAF9566273.1 hypothetical protein CPC08DRAFT_758966 [Agrocybe pediades]
MYAPQPSHTHIPQQSQLPSFMHLERLSSPIHLDGPFSAPSSTCSTRRRAKPASSKRRRMAQRVEHHVFDELPWISTLEAGPELINPWDIADLSLIPDAELSSGPGPVRRRKTSLRSSPRSKTYSSSSTSGSSPHYSIPTRDTLPLSTPPVPTPRSRFIPSRVLFHNLMPVACDFRAESPHPCITSSPNNF